MSNFETHNNKDGLEDFFNKNLYDGSMQPSKMPWENIEAALDLEEKEKKRKRIFWFFFSGIILLIGTSATWYIVSINSTPTSALSNNTHSQTQESKSVNRSHESQSIKELKKIDIPNASPHNNETSSSTTNSATEIGNLSSNVKIQLGAFSKKVNIDKFKSVPFEIQSETGEDNITRYFVVTNNVKDDLEAIKQAGFKDAFVKRTDKSTSAIAINTIEKNQTANLVDKKNTIISSNESFVSATNFPSRQLTSTKNNTNEKSNTSSLSATKNTSTASKDSNEKSTAITLQTKSLNPSVSNEKNSTSVGSTNSSDNQPEATKNNTSIESNSANISGNMNPNSANNGGKKTLENSDQNKNSTSEVKSSEPDLVNTNSSNAVDSIPKKDSSGESKKDSVILIAKVDSLTKPINHPIKKDSVKTIPDYRWAVSLIGGPNIYLNQAKTQLFDSKTESQKTTYGGEFKAEYNFIKNLSASIGVGYQSHSIQKDSTRFTFSKYMTNDYIVNSSFGPMAIDNGTLMQGFFMIAPVDSFFAAYKYTSTIQSINVPLQLNWYFLNKSRIKLSGCLGINTNYIISQQSRLTLIKEHHVDDIYYKSIQSNKINGILLLSLGCDVRLTKRLYFTLAPSYRYALTNYSKVPGIVFKPSYISGAGGFKFRF